METTRIISRTKTSVLGAFCPPKDTIMEKELIRINKSDDGIKNMRRRNLLLIT